MKRKLKYEKGALAERTTAAKRGAGKRTAAERAAAAFLAVLLAAGSCGSIHSYAASDTVEISLKEEETYDAETMEKLQDNLLEYDEIPKRVHAYNRTISDIWNDMRDSRNDLLDAAEQLESAKRYAKDKKEKAKDEHQVSDIINYTMQDIILGKAASSLRQSMDYSLYTNTNTSAIKKAENQITMAAQSLMIACDSMTKQQHILEELEELYRQQYEILTKQQELGMATDVQVHQAQANLLSARSSLESVKGGKLKITPTLFTLLGYPADGNVELGAIPAVDPAAAEQINLEEDTKKAIGNNTTLISQRTSSKGNTTAGVDARLGIIEEGEQKLTIKMKELRDEVYSKKEALESVAAGYEASQQNQAKYESMYRLGMLSQTELLGMKISCVQKKAEYEMADTSFRQALETYEWAVQGLTEIE